MALDPQKLQDDLTQLIALTNAQRDAHAKTLAAKDNTKKVIQVQQSLIDQAQASFDAAKAEAEHEEQQAVDAENSAGAAVQAALVGFQADLTAFETPDPDPTDAPATPPTP